MKNWFGLLLLLLHNLLEPLSTFLWDERKSGFPKQRDDKTKDRQTRLSDGLFIFREFN